LSEKRNHNESAIEIYLKKVEEVVVRGKKRRTTMTSRRYRRRDSLGFLTDAREEPRDAALLLLGRLIFLYKEMKSIHNGRRERQGKIKRKRKGKKAKGRERDRKRIRERTEEWMKDEYHPSRPCPAFALDERKIYKNEERKGK